MRQLRQAVDERFRHAVREILNVTVAALVDERQDGDRVNRDIYAARVKISREPNDSNSEHNDRYYRRKFVVFDSGADVLGGPRRERSGRGAGCGIQALS